MNNITAILLRSPINTAAYRVTSQRGCATVDADLTRDELKALINRLKRKLRLLKLVLGISSRAQHKNTIYKYNRQIPQFRQAREPRALDEYVRVGRAIQRLKAELSVRRAARRFVAVEMNAWKAAA